MQMKYTISIIILLVLSIDSFGQETDDLHFLEADSTWTKEIISFPLNFAPDIPFEGYEDLRFAEGWSKFNNDGFWTYVCAWNVKGKIEPTEAMLAYYIELYFDGLMGIGSKSSPVEKIKGTSALFLQETDATYSGKIKTFDTRITKSPLTLNVDTEVHFCKKTNTTVFLFRFSPKDFFHKIWSKLKRVSLRDGFCDS